jgi:hypothetical protein
MNTSIAKLDGNIAAQAAQIPSMYGRIDFSMTPDRFTVALGDQTDLPSEYAAHRPGLLANEELVRRIRAYTMIGDIVADAYAAMMPTFGFHRLVTMLTEACDRGVENVPSAPPELARFIAAMERLPDWLDWSLIEEGARVERNAYAHRAPFVIRGALIGTFMNKYSALPMVLTGALSSESSARRIKETATFFTTTVMPGALDRYGAGFKSAAMVRLMHAMVRVNILRIGDRWDAKIYGIPIPQVDQIPAGMASIFLIAQKALREGRMNFTPTERARAELARYRCFLLGLPEELLADTPRGIVDIMLTRYATLRHGFDGTCRELVEATMNADLTPDHSLSSRIHAWLEHGFAKMYFVTTVARGDRQKAAEVGVTLGIADYFGAVAAALWIAMRMSTYSLAERIPGLQGAADRALVRKLTRQLASYGHAEFTTNAEKYRAAHA